MTAFQMYSEDHFGEIGEVANIIDGSVYDPGHYDLAAWLRDGRRREKDRLEKRPSLRQTH